MGKETVGPDMLFQWCKR